MWKELSVNASTLLGVMEAILSHKTSPLERIQPVICMAVSILMKFINPCMNFVQSYISLILHAGHSSKQVGDIAVCILL